MGRKSFKLFVLSIYATLSGGALLMSGYIAHADNEGASEKKDILTGLKNYRSWTQIRKPETATTIPATLATIQIAESSVAG
jgi:hypothetical protein